MDANKILLGIWFLVNLIVFFIIYKIIFIKKKGSNLKKENDILKKLNSYQIKSSNILLTNKEKILFKLDSIDVYTLSKSIKVTSTWYLNKSVNLFKMFGSGHSYSSKKQLFTNSLRFFGEGVIVLTNFNLIIITSNGNYNIKMNNILYFDYYDINKILIIEKNKKSIILITSKKNCQVIKSWYKIDKCKPIEYEIQIISLNNVFELLTFKSCSTIVFLEIWYCKKCLISKKMSFKVIIEFILVYLINDGIYLEPDNKLLSYKQFLNKSGKCLKMQKSISNYYLNVSNTIKLENRFEYFYNILKTSEIKISSFELKYVY